MDDPPAAAHVPPEFDSARRPAVVHRVATVLRPVTIAGVAGLVAGVVVGGIGARIVMRVSAILAGTEATGAITENGNRVGEITLGGTVSLFIFGGVFSGIAGGIFLAVVSPWLPGSSLVQGVVFGTFLFAVAGTVAVDAGNRDFVVLDPALANVAMFAALFPIFGVVAVSLARRLEDRPPRLGPRTRLALYALALAVGAMFSIPTFGRFFSREFCFCADPPVATGLLLVAVAVLTAWTRLRALLGRGEDAPAAIRAVATGALLAATIVGGEAMVREVAQLL